MVQKELRGVRSRADATRLEQCTIVTVDEAAVLDTRVTGELLIGAR